jgi:Uma2 family endonuclease
MAMPALEPRVWTAAAVQALPDDSANRIECVDGALLVTPAPRTVHQSAVTVLAIRLHEALRPTGVGAVFVAPADWVLDDRTLVQPDLFVVPLTEGRRPRTDEERGHPLLFVEVLSPGSARYDRGVKRARYQRAGVEYWIVDLDARIVERWMPADDRPTVHDERIAWHPAGAAVPMKVELVPFFDEVLGPG